MPKKAPPIVPIPPVPQIPLSLPALAKVAEQDSGWLEKFRTVWALLQAFVENLVTAAEAIYGPGTGAQKKTIVTEMALKWLKEGEKRMNLIPDWIQPLVFKAVELGLDMMIEKVVKNFKKAGTI